MIMATETAREGSAATLPDLPENGSPAQYPQQRQMVPDFTLASSTGREYRLSSFRGRRDLVLVFVGAGAEAEPWAPASNLLRSLAQHTAELDDEEALVLAIFQGEMVAAEALRKRDHLPFVVLADRDGAVHRRYGAIAEAAAYLTDRYGEIYEARRGDLPSSDDLLASLRHINAACPE